MDMKRGFSLIEIIIALFVASAVFASVIPLIFNTISANRAAKLKTIAYEAAQKEIEATKNQDISALTTHSVTVPGIPNCVNCLNVKVTMTSADFALIESTVTWTFKAKQEKVELKTYKYQAAQ
jgi:prepilin-type N-terminal cleavage/methylation domain-containing protein